MSVIFNNIPVELDNTWQENAACAYSDDPDIFFDIEYPDQPKNEPLPKGELKRRRIERKERNAAAKAICAGCSVVSECLNAALTTPEPFGVWGGLTAKERITVMRIRKVA